jgi:hypothetical protein
LYGEGEYERIYYMPRREECNCYDNDSDDEDYFVEQTTKDEYNEDDPHYYDLY